MFVIFVCNEVIVTLVLSSKPKDANGTAPQSTTTDYNSLIAVSDLRAYYNLHLLIFIPILIKVFYYDKETESQKAEKRKVTRTEQDQKNRKTKYTREC